MEFNYSYSGSSAATSTADTTDMSFAPDLKREPTFFRGQLRKKLPFREAISALHAVVVSDLRFKPKDRTAYMEWLAHQEEVDWAEIAGQKAGVAKQIDEISGELSSLRQRKSERWNKFYRARQDYFDFLYKRDRDAWFVLDPVITIHPDEIFFECFSQDESSYGRLATSYEVYESLGERACGTTNVDYSQALYDEFQKIRSYKNTSLEVDPSGFEVQTSYEEAHKEVKIDLPDSWVRGFLQVSSAMTLPATRFDLHPLDVHNMCLFLRRNKELFGPRGMRYVLKPDHPVEVVFEPWNTSITCPRSIYTGEKEKEVRLWGRRRLHVLERLIGVANKFTVHALGTGLPSFYVADLGDMSFTLGLSGWTANDWSKSGNFDLMAPRAEVDELTKRRVFDGLKETWFSDTEELSKKLELDHALVLGALAAYTQAGRSIFDLAKGVYRVRELAAEPLPMERLRFANEREEKAMAMLAAGRVAVSAADAGDGAIRVEGVIQTARGKRLAPVIVLDKDERLARANCTCNFYQQNRLYQGPCEHMLAIRAAFARQLRDGVPLPQAVAGDAGTGPTTTAEVGQTATTMPSGPDAGEILAEQSEQTLLRSMWDKITGGGPRVPTHWERVAAVAVPRALRKLKTDMLIQISSGQDEAIARALVGAVGRARNLETAVNRAYGALSGSRRVKVYGPESEVRALIEEAIALASKRLEEDSE
jgi:hypothetical protein